VSAPRRREDLSDLEGYHSPQVDVSVRLNTNESPFGPSPLVAQAIAEAVPLLRLYPDPAQQRLREALAQLHDVRPEQVVAGNGADEVLAMAVRAFVSRTSFAAYLQPSYSLVPALLRINDARGEEHAWEAGFRLPPNRGN